MHSVQQIFICITFYLAAINQGSLAENSVSIKSNSSHLITTVGNILTPLLLKQVERRLLNHTATNEGVISIEKLDSSTTPINTDGIATTFKLKEYHQSSDSTTKKPKSPSVPTTVLFPIDPKFKTDKIELDSTRAQQRQLENRYPFDFRNHFDIDISGVGQQSNRGLFGSGDSFPSNQFGLLRSLDNQKADNAFLGIQGISSSQIPSKGSPIFNDQPNRPLSSPILPQDFRSFKDFDRFQYDGRYPDSNEYFNSNFRTEAGINGKFGVETSSKVGIETDAAGLGDQYNNFARQSYPPNDFPLNYQQNLRNRFQNLAKYNQGIDPVINNRPITPSINNQGIPIELPTRSYINPTLNSQNINGNVDIYSQRFQNQFPDNRNSQQEFHYSPLSAQLYFPNQPGNVGFSSSRTLVNSPTSNNNNNKNNNDNDSGVTLPSSIPSRRSEDSVTKATNNVEKVTMKIPGVESLQDHVEHEKLFIPQQDDYLDIRISPDFFKQHVLESKIFDKHDKTNIIV